MQLDAELWKQLTNDSSILDTIRVIEKAWQAIVAALNYVHGNSG
jgi:hypothetical protein